MKFTNPAPRSCSEVASQLTALFDGEADDAQARAARAHLLSCPHCSRQWLDWTRYRDTFRSEPPPVVPPTLLWRVLIAYRITAFARPARRRSRLPQISAAPLRGIEAPLPPRLNAHILARTTRKPSAHVMLTPLQGAPVAAKSRFKGRSFSFANAPLWAVPALALWILMLNRADFNAMLPVATSGDVARVGAPAPPAIASPAPANSALVTRTITPIPVVSQTARLAFSAPTPATSGAAAPQDSVARRQATLVSRSAPVASASDAAPSVSAAPSERVGRLAPTRAEGAGERNENGLSRAFALALDAGRSDIASARIAPPLASRGNFGRARVAPVVLAVAPAPGLAPIERAQTPVARSSNNVAVRATRGDAGSRVTLAALTGPISSVRTLSSARLRAATFSDDSMRPRVAHSSAAGRRLARLMPEEDAAQLRVSRPFVQAPTLREVNFGGGDNGPKIDELRSAVDDFRASVAGDE